MDFKSFMNSNKNKTKTESKMDNSNKKTSNEKKTNNDNTNNEEFIKENYKKYSKKSEKELKDELFATVNKQKKEGKFSNKDLDNFYKQVSPMLDKNQKKKMENLMRQLKK